MSGFSIKLEEYVTNSGLSYAETAKRAGIDRTQLIKMRKGERFGDERALERLGETLMLSGAQADEFRQLFLIAKMGDDVYVRHKSVKTLLEQMGHLPATLPLKLPDAHRLDALPDYFAVTGRGKVRDLLQAVIEQENAGSDSLIQVIAQPRETVLMEQLETAGRNNPKLHIAHIVCFQQCIGKGNENRYNIECFRQIVPLLISGCRYESFYYYDEIAARFNAASILPYLLLTSNCCINFSPNLDYAVFSRQADSCHMFTNIFANLIQHCKSMVTPIPDAQAHIRFYNDFYKFGRDADKSFYTFFSGPCLAVFIDQTMLFQYANHDMLHVKDVVLKYKAMMQNAYTVMRTLAMTAYFSNDGLDFFFQNGRIIEVPDKYYHPFS